MKSACFCRKTRNSLELLDTLVRIPNAPNARQLGETALAALKAVVAGDYYSAITFDPIALATEVFHPGEGWLGPANVMVQTILRTHSQHPFSQNFFPRGQSAVYQRSDLLPDRQWQRTEAYNEVDRALGIRDMAAIYQTTAAGQLVVLTVGRSGQFRAPASAPVRQLQRLLGDLPAFRTPPAPLLPPLGQALPPQATLPAVGTAGRRLIPGGQPGVSFQLNEILCITAAANYSTLLTADNRKVIVRQTMAGWLALLPAGTFLQTDRSTLINLGHIRQTDISAHCATVRFDVPVPALALGRRAAQRLKRALQANN